MALERTAHPWQSGWALAASRGLVFEVRLS